MWLLINLARTSLQFVITHINRQIDRQINTRIISLGSILPGFGRFFCQTVGKNLFSMVETRLATIVFARIVIKTCIYSNF